MRKTIVTIVLLAGTLAGCQDFKEKHPDFPKWGWWKKKPASQPTIQPSTKPAKQPSTKPAKQPASKPSKAQPTQADPKARAVIQAQPIMPAPSDHRARVWQHVRSRRRRGFPPAKRYHPPKTNEVRPQNADTKKLKRSKR